VPTLLLLLVLALCCCADEQVEQILGLRSDLMEAAEKLRRAESDKQQGEADIASLKQQVRSSSMHLVQRPAATCIRKAAGWQPPPCSCSAQQQAADSACTPTKTAR
jgi:hypothetical protein